MKVVTLTGEARLEHLTHHLLPRSLRSGQRGFFVLALGLCCDEILMYRSPQPDQRVCRATPDGVGVDDQLDILVRPELRRGESDKIGDEDRGQQLIWNRGCQSLQDLRDELARGKGTTRSVQVLLAPSLPC